MSSTSVSIVQQSENTHGVSGWQACLPPGGDWENTLGKFSSTEPAGLSPESIRLVDLSGTAHAGTNPGTAIKILWSDNAFWSKNLQFRQTKPSSRTES
jgi:hypothetical protein